MILATVMLQLATILMPGLRELLTLEALAADAIVTATVTMTWVLAALITRWAARVEPPTDSGRELRQGNVNAR